jgi:hypothetical protein
MNHWEILRSFITIRELLSGIETSLDACGAEELGSDLQRIEGDVAALGIKAEKYFAE